jgi:hypothetical protein
MGMMYAEYILDITELEFEDKHNPLKKSKVVTNGGSQESLTESAQL